MKGMYIIWPDREYVKKAVDAGVDTLLVSMYKPRPNIFKDNDYFGSYRQTVDFLGWLKNKNLPVKTILVPTWFQAWWDHLPVDHQLYNGGRHYDKVPCPTSTFHLELLLEYPIRIYNVGLCDGIMLDMEDYAKNEPGGLGYHSMKEIYPCECARCSGLSGGEQRLIQAGNIKSTLKSVKLTGLLRYTNIYLWSAFVGENWFMNEQTYKRWKTEYIHRHYFLNTITNQKMSISCGAWIEHFSAKDYLMYLWKIGKSARSDGYWIYSQMRMSRHSPFHNEPGKHDDLPYKTLVNNDFFLKLKALNLMVDRFRAGIWFKFKRLLVSLFLG